MITDFKVTVKADLGNGEVRDMDVRELDGPFITKTLTAQGLIETVEYRLNGRVVHRSTCVL
jgi:hypothetical protein